MGCTLDIHWDHFLMHLYLVSAHPIVEITELIRALMVGN